jgi:hypothetical protein
VDRGPSAQKIPRPEDTFKCITGDLDFEHYFFSLFFIKYEGLNHCFGPVYRGPSAQQIPRPEDSFKFITGDLDFVHYFFSFSSSMKG